MPGTAPIRIIPAGPEEVRQLAPLMPEAADAPTRYRFFAAVRDGALLGGAALTGGAGGHGGGAQASFRAVLTDGAPSEAADMLTHAMKVVARREGADLLTHQGGVMADSEQEQMLQRCHFSVRGEPISHFSLRTDAAELERFFASYEKLKNRGKIPEQARILPLNRLAGMTVSELLRRTIGGAGGPVHAELLNPDTCSVGILTGPTLIGAHVVSTHDAEAHTSHLAIDLAHRGSWVYTMLIAESIQRFRARGITTWSFKTNPGIHRAILNVACIVHAEHTGDERTWVFPLQ